MVAKAILAILKSAGHSGKRVKKFLNKSQDEIEDFVVNDLKDKRSINEIIKEDGKAGVNKLDDIISTRLTKKEKAEVKKYGATKAQMKEDQEILDQEVADTVREMGGLLSKGGMAKKKKPVKKAKGGMVTKWEAKWG